MYIRLAHAQLHVFMKQIVVGIKNIIVSKRQLNIDLIILFGLEIQVS